MCRIAINYRLILSEAVCNLKNYGDLQKTIFQFLDLA
jgi:hypothetical protein